MSPSFAGGEGLGESPGRGGGSRRAREAEPTGEEDALDRPMFEGLLAAARRLAKERAVHAVVLSGAGGCHIALGADMRIVAPDVRIAFVEITWLLVPDLSGTQALRRIASLDVSKKLIYTGEPITGEQAVALLLATEVSDAPLETAFELAPVIAGETREPPLGMQKFDWNPKENRFVESWFLADIDNTDWMPPTLSPQNGLAYVATKVDSVYEYRAVDWETGEVVARWPFPDDSVLWNNWGGITTLLEDGDLLLGGFFAVKRYDVGHLR